MLTGLTMLALLASPPQTGIEEAYLRRAPEGSVLTVGNKEYPVVGDRLAWSPNGRRVAVYSLAGGPVSVLHVASGSLRQIAERASTPFWARDDAKLAFDVPGSGLTVFDASLLSEPPRVVAKDATPGSAAWAPDSDRLAYATNGDLWIADVAGTTRRRIIRGRTAACSAWSPDGRWLAFAEPPLRGLAAPVWRIRPSGTGLTKLTTSPARRLAWSPNSRWLLTETATGWGALESARPKLQEITTRIRPAWVGSAKLLVGDAAGWGTLTLGADPKRESLGTMLDVKEPLDRAAKPYLELTADLGGSAIAKEAVRPQPSELLLQGYIEAADPIDGHYTVRVNTMVDGRGREINLSDGVSQGVRMEEKPGWRQSRNGKELPVPRSTDLRPDAEVTLLVRGTRLDTQMEMPIQAGWVEGDSTTNVIAPRGGPRLKGLPLDYDGVSREKVVVPMIFPVVGRCNWSDWFLAARGGGTRRHHGQDLMAAKMTPLVAAFDGVVFVGRSSGVGGHNTLSINGDNGWTVNYYHINNDTPGTNDGMGTDDFAFAPGLSSGQRVFAGQFVAYVGNSGNAETTDPHCHFELWDNVTHGVVNAAPSLRAAGKIDQPLARRLPSEIDVRPGEVRYDGIIRDVDLAKGIVRTQLLSRTIKGKSKAVMRAESLYARLSKSTDCHLLGNENLPLSLSELRPGLYAILVGPANRPGAAVGIRRAAFGMPQE